MAFLLQVAATIQATPSPVHVILDQPPSLPDWEKVLITASAGAVFGIVGSIAMEFLKPLIAKSTQRKTIRKQLGAELLDNMNNIEAAIRVAADVKDKPAGQQAGAMNLCGVLIDSCKMDRFDHYFAEEKSLVYEIDDDKILQGLYALLKGPIQPAVQRRDLPELTQLLAAAGGLADGYIKQQKLTYVPAENTIEQIYRKTTYVPDATSS